MEQMDDDGYSGLAGYSGGSGFIDNSMQFGKLSIFLADGNLRYSGDFHPTHTGKKRIEKMRKKHPEYSDCFKKMEQKAYGDKPIKKTMTIAEKMRGIVSSFNKN